MRERQKACLPAEAGADGKWYIYLYARTALWRSIRIDGGMRSRTRQSMEKNLDFIINISY